MPRKHLLLSFVLFLLLLPTGKAQETECPCTRTGDLPPPDDGKVYISIFRDSVPAGGDKFDPVEVRILDTVILSVHRAGREVPPEEYEELVPHLFDLLLQKKKLKARLSASAAEQRDLLKALDSLEHAPVLLGEISVGLDEVRNGNYLRMLADMLTEIPAEDTVPRQQEPDFEQLKKWQEKAERILYERQTEIESLQEKIEQLQDEVESTRSALEEIQQNFTFEPYQPEKSEQKATPKGTKKKKRRKRLFRSRS